MTTSAWWLITDVPMNHPTDPLARWHRSDYAKHGSHTVGHTCCFETTSAELHQLQKGAEATFSPSRRRLQSFFIRSICNIFLFDFLLSRFCLCLRDSWDPSPKFITRGQSLFSTGPPCWQKSWAGAEESWEDLHYPTLRTTLLHKHKSLMQMQAKKIDEERIESASHSSIAISNKQQI